MREMKCKKSTAIQALKRSQKLEVVDAGSVRRRVPWVEKCHRKYV
jgi:hypothetical protein